MNILIIVVLSLIVYLVQALLCVLANTFIRTRIPRNFRDLLRLTFIPTLILEIVRKKHNID